MSLTLTTLIENAPSPNPALAYEHGLSLYIDHPDCKILFDTGQSGDFIKNAELLQKDLTALDYVLISHGHLDHSGGVPKLLESRQLSTSTRFLVGSEFFTPKFYTLEDGTHKFIGNSFNEQDVVNAGVSLTKLEDDTTYLTDNIVVFHHFKQSNDFEPLAEKFLIQEGNQYVVDSFRDEIALGIITEKGLVVIVGCSHIGISNILTDIQARMNMPIYEVVGGTHLVAADEERIALTIEGFKKLGVQKIAVSHCTGDKAIGALKEYFGSGFIRNNTGDVITFP